MIKSTLKQHLEDNGSLEKGILVSSLLIKEIEVCGFLNGAKKFQQTSDCYLHMYNSILNKVPHRMLVRSGMVHQVFEYYDGNGIAAKNCVFKIFPTLVVNKESFDVEMKDIHVPAFETSTFYRELRKGYSRLVTEQKLRKNGFPDFVKVKDDKVICEVEPGRVLCLNSDGEIRALGEEIQVLCRYVHAETGTMCYTVYSLDELYI